jgi:hypothetical protein
MLFIFSGIHLIAVYVLGAFLWGRLKIMGIEQKLMLSFYIAYPFEFFVLAKMC